jgi:hypothetical protein
MIAMIVTPECTFGPELHAGVTITAIFRRPYGIEQRPEVHG